MTRFEKEVYDMVQAALLNSQCSPRDAVRVALEAVAGFAANEDVCPADEYGESEAWIVFAHNAWKKPVDS